jgi:hypothetical protein
MGHAPARDLGTGAVRLVRGLLLALPAVGTATLGHASVDGCVEVLGVASALSLSWASAVAIVGTRRRTSTLLTWVVLAQALSHVVLSASCDGWAHARQLPSPQLLLTHGAAALVMAVLLGHGDAGLWTAQQLVRAARRLLAPAPVLSVPSRRVLSVPRPVLLTTTLPLHELSRRGPPRRA